MGSVFRKHGKHYWIKWKDLQNNWRMRPAALQPDGSRPDLAAAQAELRKLEYTLYLQRTGEPPADVAQPTVAELITWYAALPTSRREAHTPSTLASLRKHLVEHPIGRINARQLSARDVDAWLQDLHTNAGLNISTCNWLKGLFGAAYNTAQRREWPAQGFFPRNPPYNAFSLKDPTAVLDPREQYPVLEQAHIPALLQALPPDHRCLVACALLLGMRWGELCQLDRDSVDTANKRVYVLRGKTDAAARTLPLPDALVPWLTQQLAEVTDRWPTSTLVFPNRQGRMRGDKGGGSMLGPLRAAIKRAGLPTYLHEMNFHDLRHTAASLLVQQGASLPEVSKFLGHASTRVTEKVYLHLSAQHLPSVQAAQSLLATSVEAPVATVYPLERKLQGYLDWGGPGIGHVVLWEDGRQEIWPYSG